MRWVDCKRSGLLMVALLGLTAVQDARAGSTVGGPIHDPYTNQDIYIVSPGSWTEIESYAQTLGGHLITVHSAAENAFIVTDVLKDWTSVGGPDLSATPVWIGLYNPTPGSGSGSDHATGFVWADGSSSTYRNWEPGEPNNFLGEDYAALNWHFAAGLSGTPGTWNDTPVDGTSGTYAAADGPYYGIITVGVPEPSSCVLLMIGGAGLGLIRRRRPRPDKVPADV